MGEPEQSDQAETAKSESTPAPAQPEPTPAERRQQALAALALALEEQGARGANWFYWVAGLSLVNSVIHLTGGTFGFIVGLGATSLVDALATDVVLEDPESELPVKLVAFGVNLFIALIVAGFGWLSRRRIAAVFAIGMALYLLDGLLFVIFESWPCVVFHAFVLWCMWSGLKAYQQLKAVVMELQAQSPGQGEEPDPLSP